MSVTDSSSDSAATIHGGGRGRPRDPDTDHRILAETLRLLSQEGYARMSLDAVAAAAGVTKPTIYRRYRGKAELAEAALAALATARDASAPVEKGVLRDDLVAHLRHFRAGVSRPYGVALVGAVLAEERETPGLLALYRQRIVEPRRRMIRGVLAKAAADGALRHAADLDLAVNALVGAYYAQSLAGEPFADDWEERIVDTLLAGIAA